MRLKSDQAGMSRGPVDEQAIRESLNTRFKAKEMPEGQPRPRERRNESARLQNARDQYDMAMNEKGRK